MKKNIFLGSLISGILAFSLTEAASFTNDVCAEAGMGDVTNILNWGSCLLVKTVVPLLFALAVVGFIWGIIQFYLNPENEEKRKKGKSFIVGGLIALFVMTSMWGLVSILTNTFETGNTLPQLPE